MSNGTIEVSMENVHEALALIENITGNLPFGSEPHRDLLRLKMIVLNMLMGTGFNVDSLASLILD